MIQISSFMTDELIFLDIPGKNREEVLISIVDRMVANCSGIQDGEVFKREVLEREKLGGTGIGDEFAIPHARTKQVTEMLIAFARTRNPIDFEAIDGQRVRYIFLIAVPLSELKIYLTTLAAISRLVKNERVRAVFRQARTGSELLKTLQEIE